MTLEQLIAALTGERQQSPARHPGQAAFTSEQDSRSPASRALGALYSPTTARPGERVPNFLAGTLGMVNVEPPKTLPPLRDDQWQMPMGPGAEPLPRPQPPPLPLDAELKLQGRPFEQLRYRGGALDMSDSPTLSADGPARGMEPLDAPAPPSGPLGPRYIPRPDPELAALLSRDLDGLQQYRLENERELGALRSRAETAAENAARIERDRQRFEQNRWPRPDWWDSQPDRRFSPRSNRP